MGILLTLERERLRLAVWSSAACVVAAAASGKRARAGGTGWHKARDGTCPAAPASIGVELFAGTVGSKT